MSGVTTLQFGVVEQQNLNPLTWPSGEEIMSFLRQVDALPKSDDEMASSPRYWQGSARYTLLKHYGLLGPADASFLNKTTQPYKTIESGRRVQLVLTESEMDAVQKQWEYLFSGSNEEKEREKTNDLSEFLTSAKSNNRSLTWACMICPSGCQFKLHAHPNLELIYVARGEIHEVRMAGEPLTKNFERESDTVVRGPNLTSLQRPWYFRTACDGQWFVNEVGSIHKSFTSSRGDGCVIMCLWGGSHADVQKGQEPLQPNVADAVNRMDAKVGTIIDKKEQCDDCISKWEQIQETFLPESERSLSSDA